MLHNFMRYEQKCTDGQRPKVVLFINQNHERSIRIIMMDVYGRQLAVKEITSEQTILDVRLLPNGVYFYRVTLEGIFYSGKLVIQK